VAIFLTIHVLAAVIGIGPTSFLPALLRPRPSVPELRGALAIGQRLARYPQVGGPVALLIGIGLVFASDTRLLGQTWIRGTLVLFVVIQVIVVGLASRRRRSSASGWPPRETPPRRPCPRRSPRSTSASATLTRFLGTALFVPMILKPS
jgi:hypothetical protein